MIFPTEARMNVVLKRHPSEACLAADVMISG